MMDLRERTSLIIRFVASVAILGLGCGGSQPRPQSQAASAAAGPEQDGNIARLQRERDEADHRARDAQQAAGAAQGRCDLTQHELDSLRERDTFEELVWYRIGQAETSATLLRDQMSGAPKARRLAVEATLKGADEATGSVERSLRRVHRVPDAEWARYRHDLESTLDGLDRSLREAH